MLPFGNIRPERVKVPKYDVSPLEVAMQHREYKKVEGRLHIELFLLFN